MVLYLIEDEIKDIRYKIEDCIRSWKFKVEGWKYKISLIIAIWIGWTMKKGAGGNQRSQRQAGGQKQRNTDHPPLRAEIGLDSFVNID